MNDTKTSMPEEGCETKKAPETTMVCSTKDDKNEVKFHEEIQKMEYEPMNDTEIRLVRNSIVLGVVLLVVFYFVSGWLFPNAHA